MDIVRWGQLIGHPIELKCSTVLACSIFDDRGWVDAFLQMFSLRCFLGTCNLVPLWVLDILLIKKSGLSPVSDVNFLLECIPESTGHRPSTPDPCIRDRSLTAHPWRSYGSSCIRHLIQKDLWPLGGFAEKCVVCWDFLIRGRLWRPTSWFLALFLGKGTSGW